MHKEIVTWVIAGSTCVLAVVAILGIWFGTKGKGLKIRRFNGDWMNERREAVTKKIGLAKGKQGKTFIVKMWSWIFCRLERITPYYIIKKRIIPKPIPDKEKSWIFVEGWVLGHLLFSLLWWRAFPTFQAWWLLLLLYPLIRIFEVVVYHMNQLLDCGKAKELYKKHCTAIP